MTLIAGKKIASIPNQGGLFSIEQLRQSSAWPALKFMVDQVALFAHLSAAASLNHS
jgi:hypothetical protein